MNHFPHEGKFQESGNTGPDIFLSHMRENMWETFPQFPSISLIAGNPRNQISHNFPHFSHCGKIVPVWESKGGTFIKGEAFMKGRIFQKFFKGEFLYRGKGLHKGTTLDAKS